MEIVACDIRTPFEHCGLDKSAFENRVPSGVKEGGMKETRHRRRDSEWWQKHGRDGDFF
jgi:hypothetical protein